MLSRPSTRTLSLALSIVHHSRNLRGIPPAKSTMASTTRCSIGHHFDDAPDWKLSYACGRCGYVNTKYFTEHEYRCFSPSTRVRIHQPLAQCNFRDCRHSRCLADCTDITVRIRCKECWVCGVVTPMKYGRYCGAYGRGCGKLLGVEDEVVWQLGSTISRSRLRIVLTDMD